jgi:hypothetical protein
MPNETWDSNSIDDAINGTAFDQNDWTEADDWSSPDNDLSGNYDWLDMDEDAFIQYLGGDNNSGGNDLLGTLGSIFKNSDTGDMEWGNIAALLGGLGTAQGWFDSEQDKVGYQGEIPKYEAVRSVVPGAQSAEGRRPGEAGQRYFSDTVFAQKPDEPVPTVDQARAATHQQAQDLEPQRTQDDPAQTALDNLRDDDTFVNPPVVPDTTQGSSQTNFDEFMANLRAKVEAQQQGTQATPDPAVTTPDVTTPYETPKMTALQERLAAQKVKTDALRAEYEGYDQTKGMQAQGLLQLMNNPNVPQVTLDQVAAQYGIDLADVEALAAGYTEHKAKIAELRGEVTPLSEQGGIAGIVQGDTPQDQPDLGEIDWSTVQTPSNQTSGEYQTPKMAAMQPRIASLNARSDALRNEYDSFDSGRGMQAGMLDNLMTGNGIFGGKPVDQATIDRLSTQWGIPTADAAGISSDYDAHRQRLLDIRAQPGFAQGGLASLKGYYMGGPTDGMADQVPAMIEGQEPAAISHGEFVIPADAVAHFGNGNSESGAQELYDMVARVRQATTGKKTQANKINPKQYMLG